MRFWSRFHCALVCTAVLVVAGATSGQGEETDGLTVPAPLFAPSNPSYVGLPASPARSPATGLSSTLDPKEALYERLRQGLLRLEMDFQQRSLQEQQQRSRTSGAPTTSTEPTTQTSPATPDQTGSSSPPSVPLLDSSFSAGPEADAVRSTDETSPPAEDSPNLPAADLPEPALFRRPFDMSALGFSSLGTPNLISLADNLYALGEYDLAYNSYRGLSLNELSADDQVWVIYQQAGCLRHLQQDKTAASLYRQILTRFPEHHLAPISGWWLDTMEDKTWLDNQLSTLRDSLRRTQESSHAPVSPR